MLAATYDNMTICNADVGFNGDSANLYKLVHVGDDPPLLFQLVDNTPTWIQFTGAGHDEFMQLLHLYGCT